MNKPIKYSAFDLEITKILPDGVRDWSVYRPLGISCAATMTSDGEIKTWYGQGSEGEFKPGMSVVELRELVKHLQDQAAAGYTILTWNGLGFDFDILTHVEPFEGLNHFAIYNYLIIPCGNDKIRIVRYD